MAIKENTPMGNAVVTLSKESQYDKRSKEVLAWKPIMSRILKRVMPEFADYSFEQVEKSIEGKVEISERAVNPSEGCKIDGNSNEGSIVGEGNIYYDIITYVILPNKEMTKVIINIEAQKKDEPGYDLVTRAIFYCARLISQQLNREFHNTSSDNKKYNGIKKVYSIWICMNAEQNQADSIVEYRIKPNVLHFGEHKERRYQSKKHRYDLMAAVMIYLSAENWKSTDSLIDMLNTLFGELEASSKKRKLQEEHGLKMVKEIEQVVNDMCNLGEGLAERYMDIGIQKGLQQGIQRGMQRGMQRGIQRGMQQGLQRGEIVGIEKMAVKMLKMSEPVKKIKEYTELTIERIKELADENGLSVAK